MDDKVILKYIAGKVSDREKEEVLDWIDAAEGNRQYFNKLKNAWVVGSLPDREVSDIQAKYYVNTLRRKVLRRRIIYSGVAAIVILLISMGVQYRFQQYSDEIDYLKGGQVASLEYRTNKGLKGMVTLPDGTKVWLNSDSRLSCPARFAGDKRIVEFSGEGFFDVVKDPEHPMMIRLDGGISIVVKGTKFNLSSYRNDDKIAALLLEGEISVVREGIRNQEELKVAPNEKIYIAKSEKKVEKMIPREILPTVGWKEGWLIFDEAPMSEVLKKLERWHGMRFIVEDPSILNKKFTARFKDESISQILEAMKKVSLLDYQLEDSTATLMKY